MSQKTTRVITQTDVRLSYVNVLTPAKGMDDSADAKYSTAILIPKKDKETLQAIKEAIELAKEEGKVKKWGGKIPNGLKTPIRDGDEERPDDPAYKGMYFLNASSKRKPQVIDRHKNPIDDPMEIYSGVWARVSINFYPYNTNGNRGIGAGLGNILKTRDDESLGGGGARAEDEFSDMLEDDGGANFDFG